MNNDRLQKLLINTVTLLEKQNPTIHRMDLLKKVGMSRIEIKQFNELATDSVLYGDYQVIGSINTPDGRQVILSYNADERTSIPYISAIKNVNGIEEHKQYLTENNRDKALIHLFNRAAKESGFNLSQMLDETDKESRIKTELKAQFTQSEFNLLRNNKNYMDRVIEEYFVVEDDFDSEQLGNTIQSVYEKMVQEGRILPASLLNELNGKECTLRMNTYNEITGTFACLNNRNDVFLFHHDQLAEEIYIKSVKEISYQNKIKYVKDPSRPIYGMAIDLCDGKNVYEIEVEDTSYIKLKKNLTDIIVNHLKTLGDKEINIFEINTQYTINGNYKDSDFGYIKINNLSKSVEFYYDLTDAMDVCVVDFNEEVLISESNDSINVYLVASDELVERSKRQLVSQKEITLSEIDKIENMNFYAEYDFTHHAATIIGDCYVGVNGNKYKEFELHLNDIEEQALINQIERQFTTKHNKKVIDWVNEQDNDKPSLIKKAEEARQKREKYNKNEVILQDESLGI